MDFTTTGIHIYEVAVVASGTAGIMTNGSIEVEVLVTYEPPPELVNALTTGSWRVKAEAPGHMGVGPIDDQAPDGMALWWNGIHSRLKICRSLRAYGFESPQSYQF